MVEKIHFLGGDWKEKLKENFGEENLFEKWGGTKAASTPTGSIRMAGEVPHELRLAPGFFLFTCSFQFVIILVSKFK